MKLGELISLGEVSWLADQNDAWWTVGQFPLNDMPKVHVQAQHWSSKMAKVVSQTVSSNELESHNQCKYNAAQINFIQST